MNKLAVFLCVFLILSITLSACGSTVTDASTPEPSVSAESEGTEAEASAQSLPDSGDDDNDSSGESAASSMPEEGGMQVSSAEENGKTPYIPKNDDFFMEFPSLYQLDGNFDTGKNNQAIGQASFYLDSAMFVPVKTEYENFLVFDSVEGSDVGPCSVSVLCEPIEAMMLTITDVDGRFVPVASLNYAVDNFLQQMPDGEVFTYFSENVREHYIPGAIFVNNQAVGFIFYFTDDQSVYSIQWLSYDSSYADFQKSVIADMINSITFLQ